MQNAPMQIDKSCINCSGNAGFVNKAFKMACLNYTSTKVHFDDMMWSRDDLLAKKLLLVTKSIVDAGAAKTFNQDAANLMKKIDAE